MRQRDYIAEAAHMAASAVIHRQDEGLPVTFASRDDALIRAEAPKLARILYPGRIIGLVIHHEPMESPAAFAGRRWPNGDPLEWSEVIVADHGAYRRPRNGIHAPTGSETP